LRDIFRWRGGTRPVILSSMSKPQRIFEGRFGRLVLADGSAAGEELVHPHPLILLKVDGADCTVSIGGERHPLSREDALLANPGLPVRHEGSLGGTTARLIEFHPSLDWLRQVFPAVFEDAADVFPRVRETIAPRIRQLADSLAIEALNDQFLSPERLEFMLQELMLCVVESYLARRRAGASLWRGSRFADTRIRKALGLLRARPNKDTNIDELASQVGLSRSRFYDLFQVCTGRSPRAYLDLLCVESAIAKLSSGRSRIADVSAELGFSAQSNFTRFFLNQVGIPPSEYRRAASRPADDGAPAQPPEPKT
jgi:AraC-like DNA-binding protein